MRCREHAPSIIFMDEVDSIGSARSESGGGGGGDSEVQRTMLELLNQLDGFEATNKIKVLLRSFAGQPRLRHWRRQSDSHLTCWCTKRRVCSIATVLPHAGAAGFFAGL